MNENITKPLDKEQIRFFLERIQNVDWQQTVNVLCQLFNYLEETASESSVYQNYKDNGESIFLSNSRNRGSYEKLYQWKLPSEISNAKIFAFYIYFGLISKKHTLRAVALAQYDINQYDELVSLLNRDLMPYLAKAIQDIENDCITFDSAGLGSDTQKLWNTNIIIYGDVIGSAISAMGKAELNIEDVQNYSGLDSDELNAILLALYKEVYSESEPQPSLWEKLKGMAPATAAMLLKYVLENSEKIPELIKNII